MRATGLCIIAAASLVGGLVADAVASPSTAATTDAPGRATPTVGVAPISPSSMRTHHTAPRHHTTTTTTTTARPRATSASGRSVSTSTTTTSTTTTTIALPQPVAPPIEDGTRDPEMVLGRIEIPAIELDRELHEGIRLTTLNDGPGHWPGTAMPGELGNAVVAGHRTSAGADFRHLDELVAGDEVVITTPEDRFVYLVESTEIVAPDAIRIIEQTPEHRATLFACHPPGSVRERIVVHLRLAEG